MFLMLGRSDWVSAKSYSSYDARMAWILQAGACKPRKVNLSCGRSIMASIAEARKTHSIAGEWGSKRSKGVWELETINEQHV